MNQLLRAWRIQLCWQFFVDVAVTTLGWSCTVFSCLAILDHLVVMPSLVFWTVWLSTLIAAAAFAGAKARTLTRRLDAESIFLRAEARWSQARLLLASGWALRCSQAHSGESDALRRVHLERADAAAQTLHGTHLYPLAFSLWMRAGILCGVTLVIAAKLLGADLSWRRVLTPWREITLDHWIVLEPGDVRFIQGSAMTITARADGLATSNGVRPADIVLETRRSDGVWQSPPGQKFAATSMAVDLGIVTDNMDYRARWRDAVTSVRRLTAVHPPRFIKATATVHGSRGDQTYILGEDSPIRARQGDWVSIRGEAKTEFMRAQLRVPGISMAVPMSQSKDGSWNAGYSANSSGPFGFDLIDRDGLEDPSPPRYDLTVLADAPPSIELLSPQMLLQAGVNDSVPFVYSARDDNALKVIELVAQAGAREIRRALPLETGIAEVLSDARLSLRGFPLGAKVEFWLEAIDDASTAQRARSMSGFVEIVDIDAAHKETLAQKEKAMAALERAAGAARDAAAEATRGDEGPARAALQTASNRWDIAASALMSWTRALGEDSQSDPALIQTARESAQNMANAGLEGFAKAGQAINRRDRSEAAKELMALAEHADLSLGALRSAAAIQQRSDAATLASRAALKSGDLDEQIGSVEGGRGMDLSRAPESLQAALAEVESAMRELQEAFAALPEGGNSDTARELPLGNARAAAENVRRALSSGDFESAAKAARELSRELSALANDLRQSAENAAQGHASRASQAASQLATAWREAVLQQEQATEAAHRVDASQRERTLSRQRELIQKALETVRSGLATSPMPAVEQKLKIARVQLETGAVAAARPILREAANVLRSTGSNSSQLGAVLDEAERHLDPGAALVGADPAAFGEAARLQGSAKTKAASLREDITQIAKTAGVSAGEYLHRVDRALEEQNAAESALVNSDLAEALRRSDAALTILSQSNGAPGGAGGSGGSESRGSSGGGMITRQSARPEQMVGRVRLPSADTYRPARELREELDRSLLESRPRNRDAAIKEYFRRLAR